MSMEHKAFVFDYEAFSHQLGDILRRALVTRDSEALVAFIQANIGSLKDPYEGKALPHEWQNMLERGDEQECGDIALTKFYDPGSNIGLAYEWQDIQSLLGQRLRGNASAVLGEPFGPASNPFDPGRMGSYFQSPSQARDNLTMLKSLVLQEPQDAPRLRELVRMLTRAADAGKGLYVTL